MPSPKALPTGWYGLLNGHLGVAKADGLGLAARAGSHHKLLSRTWSAPWAVAG